MQEATSPGKLKSNPSQILYDDSDLASHISDLFKDAFGVKLVIDYRGGTHIPFHVGHEPTKMSGEDKTDNSYVDRVRSLPKLENQGDGMRSFAGMLFETLVSSYDVTLIDEPEVFLHPPQIRKLAAILSREATKQVFVASHSSDILRGFLGQKRDTVRVVRLQRLSDGAGGVHEVSSEHIRELWNIPELRYSNALEAIFHDRAILCEADADCRFYNAVMDFLEAKDKRSPWPDSLFVPCGGKQGLIKFAMALHRLGVTQRLILDIDVLNDGDNIRAAVEAIGGDWKKLEPMWRIVDSNVRSGVKPLSPQEIKAQLRRLIDNAAPTALPKGDIASTLKQTSPWSLIKHVGKSAIPKGDAASAYDNLDEGLQSIGIHLVPVGQLEGFRRQVPNHGPEWVAKVLQTIPLNSPKLAEARRFVTQVCAPPRSKGRQLGK